MTLQTIIAAKLLHVAPIDILRELGYRNITTKYIARLLSVIKEPDLGLSSSHFDFKYSNVEFIQALCKLFDINFEARRAEVEAMVSQLTTLRYGFIPYIFVDTGFKRTSQPIFSLACMESHRRLRLPAKVRIITLEEQVKFVSDFVKSHHVDTTGKLPLWGDIKHYVFYYAEKSRIIFNTSGEIVDDIDIYVTQATLTIGNKEITSLLSK